MGKAMHEEVHDELLNSPSAPKAIPLPLAWHLARWGFARIPPTRIVHSAAFGLALYTRYVVDSFFLGKILKRRTRYVVDSRAAAGLSLRSELAKKTEKGALKGELIRIRVSGLGGTQTFEYSGAQSSMLFQGTVKATRINVG